MERFSNRWYLAQLAWLDSQWNKPDRNDHYLMQVALQLDRIFNLLAQNKKSIKLSEFEIPFESVKVEVPLNGKPKTNEMSAEQAVATSKAVWAARLNLNTEQARELRLGKGREQ